MRRNPGASIALYNASFEPLGSVDFRQAVRMLFRQVAVVHEADPDRGSIGPHPWPVSVRLIRYVVQKWMYGPARWHRGGVFIRDGHRCAYCGAKATTIDHLLPRSRGGEWSWLNCVAACSGCNERKGSRTPEEAKMPLRFARPYVPIRAELVGR